MGAVEPSARPFFSIVVPVFRAEATVGAAIASLRGQAFADWEAVFVDDGSPDGSAAAVLAAAAGDSRIRLLRHGGNRGTHAARRTGVGASRGAWVLFLDPDDGYAPGALGALAERLRGTDADLVRFDFAPMRPELCSPDQLDSFARHRCGGRSTAGPGAALPLFFTGRNVPIFPWSFAVRGSVARTAFAETEDVRLVYAEGVYEVFACAARADGYAEIPVEAYRYRAGAGGTTSWRHAPPDRPDLWLAGFERTLGARAASFAAMRRFARAFRGPAAARRRVRAAVRKEARRQLAGVYPWEFSLARAKGLSRERFRACLGALLRPLAPADRLRLRVALALRRVLEAAGILQRPGRPAAPRSTR